MNETDRALVTAFLRRRDERAFLRLYRRHTDRLYGMAVRLLGGPEEAQDAVQETWARAVRALPGFRWESALSTWMCAILIRHCRERWRSPREGADDGALRGEPGAEDKVLLHLVDRLALERAIAALPDGYRHVLVLHDIEGYTHEEIARMSDIEPGTSKSQLSRARRALRRSLTSGESTQARTAHA